MRTGNITNIGGVVNFGTIYGNVRSGIQRAYETSEASPESAVMLEQMRDELLKLTQQINANAKELDKPEDALGNVEQFSKEIFGKKPDGSKVESWIGKLFAAARRVPSIVEILGKITDLFQNMRGLT